MQKELNIDIQRTGFPVKVGTVKLWFDSSLENLRNFFNVDEIAQEKLKEAQEKAKHIHFPADTDNIENIDVKTINAAFDVNKEFIAAQYDIVFGDGAFKKIYDKHPDILALEQALEPLCTAISQRIEGMEVERTKRVEEKKSEHLAKKAKKK